MSFSTIYGCVFLLFTHCFTSNDSSIPFGLVTADSYLIAITILLWICHVKVITIDPDRAISILLIRWISRNSNDYS